MTRSDALRCTAVVLCATFGVSGCSHDPLPRAGVLSSYDSMKPQPGVFTKSEVRSDRNVLKAAKTASIVPIGFTASASNSGLTLDQQALVSNATNRALCNELSRQFHMVAPGQPADLKITGAITYVKETDAVAAGVSKIGSTAVSFASPLPIPLKRLPMGMGGLMLEAEARTPTGEQAAAIIWARDADVFTSKPRVSAAGDAYDLASEFSRDFSRQLRIQKFEISPAAVLDFIPSSADVAYAIDGTPKAEACAAYGNGPGIVGQVAGGFGAPPEWTDDAGRTPARPKPAPVSSPAIWREIAHASAGN